MNLIYILFIIFSLIIIQNYKLLINVLHKYNNNNHNNIYNNNNKINRKIKYVTFADENNKPLEILIKL